MGVVWKGSTEIEEQPGSPRWKYQGDGTTCIRTFRGPLAALRGGKPAIGASMQDLGDDDLLVDVVELYPLVGGSAEMVVTLADTGEDSGVEQETVQPVFEVEWTSVERPIEQHPRYRIGGGGPAQQTEESLREIEGALANPKDPLPFAVGSPAHELYVKKLAGQTSYLAPVPVLRRTSNSYKRPVSTALGKQGINDFPDVPPDYKWLQSADRAMRQGRRGRWERAQEWLGAEYWDEHLYPEAD